jgi:hypothetical protein
MESPRPLQESKQVRWLGRPSEEQLLGSLHRPLREVNVSFEPTQPPEWALSETPVTDGAGVDIRRWRFGPRDLVALAAVAAVIWLAVRGSDGLPFRSSNPAGPAAAGEIVRTTLAPDRLDLKRTATRPDAKTHRSKKADGQKDQKGSTRSGGKHGNPPTDGTGDDQTKRLLEAIVPGVGTVTVDEPELPTVPDLDAPQLPALPDTDDILPETPTVSLP